MAGMVGDVVRGKPARIADTGTDGGMHGRSVLVSRVDFDVARELHRVRLCNFDPELS